MKKLLLLSVVAMIIFSSCSNLSEPFGKKITTNEYVEVYYKGDSVTEAEAKKLGDYVAKTWDGLKDKKSMQLTKDKGEYLVKMVVDEEKIKADTSLDISFMVMQSLFRSEVFNGGKVKLILTNNKFEDIRAFDDKLVPTTDSSKGK